MLVGAPGGVKDRARQRARDADRWRQDAQTSIQATIQSSIQARLPASVHTSMRRSAGRLGERYATHRERIRRLALQAGAGVAVAGLALGWLLWGSQLTRVEEVNVTILDPRAPSSGQPLTDGTQRARSAQILRHVAVPVGEPLVDVDTSELSRQVEELKRYSRVSVDRAWPDRVDIIVTPRVPVLAVANGGAAVQLLDGDGVAFERVDQAPAGVPTATLSGDRQAAGRAAVSALLALPGPRRDQVRELRIDPQGGLELQVGEVRVRWGGSGHERLKGAVVDALVDSVGITTLDVSAPQRPVTTGGD